MALKRKGSRSIRVGGESFWWTVSRSIQAETGKISVIIEPVEKPGRRIAVRVPCRDFWLDFSDLRDAPPAGFAGAYRPVTPALVQKIILAALAAGWLPQQRQKNLVLQWSEKEILIPLEQNRDAERKLIRKRR